MNDDNKILNKDGQEDAFDLVGLLFEMVCCLYFNCTWIGLLLYIYYYTDV